MRVNHVFKVLSVCVAAGLVSSAAADVINFDDLVGQAPVPNGYGTVVDWSGWTYYDWAQSPYNPHSPPCRVYNTSNGTFKFGREVVFEGAWFSGYGTNRGFLPISFQLYNNNALVHTSGSIDLGDGSGPTWLDSGFTGAVDTVVVQGSHGFYVMDDVTFHEGGCPSDFTARKGGTCPSANSISWSGSPANASVRVLYTSNNGTGGTIPPNSPCPGTTLCIGLGGVTLHSQVLHSDGSGNGSTPNFSAPCGLHLQLITQSSCKTSNRIDL